MKTWIVTHTNLSDEKFYWKVQAETRQAAKEVIVTRENVYLSTLTARPGTYAEILNFMGHSQCVSWDYWKRD